MWRKTSWEERSQVLHKLAGAFRTHKTDIAQTMHSEMGKLLSEAKAEVEKCAVTCEFYAKEASGMLRNQTVTTSPYNKAEVSFSAFGSDF